MASVGERVTVQGSRDHGGIVRDVWCNGKSGTVLRVEGDIVIVKLDDVNARELRFLATELVDGGR